jgi:hypothetical protein
MSDDTVTIKFDPPLESTTYYAKCPCGHQTQIPDDPANGVFFTCEGCGADYAVHVRPTSNASPS